MNRKHLSKITLLLLGLIWLMSFAGPSLAQEAVPAPHLSIVASGLNVRSGPGPNYFLLGFLSQGQSVPILGQHSASGWWQIQQPNGIIGWVSNGSAFGQTSGNLSQVPAVPAPSLYPALPLLSNPLGLSASPAAPANPALSGTLVFQASSGGQIYAINADGTNLRPLTTGLDPALSPDGTQVAFTRWQDGQDGAFGAVWLIDLADGNERVVLSDVRQPKAPTWSADGAQLLITMQAGGWLEPKSTCGHQKAPPKAYDIYREPGGIICYTLPPNPYWSLRVLDLASGHFEDLPGDNHSISPSFDPSQAWRAVFDGDFGLVGLDVTQQTTWPLSTDPADHSPVIAPDGQSLALSYWQSDHWEIHRLNMDGTERIRLTETPLSERTAQRLAGETVQSWHNTAPTWSPDGSQIAFLSNRSGAWQIWLMTADGLNQRPMFGPDVLAGIQIDYHNMSERVLSWR
jgi:dipeptidyl aminopeptidase/acylaminoacyl peptidase